MKLPATSYQLPAKATATAKAAIGTRRSAIGIQLKATTTPMKLPAASSQPSQRNSENSAAGYWHPVGIGYTNSKTNREATKLSAVGTT